jgi:hypothetical protein
MIALMMAAVDTSATSVNFYHTTLRNIPEDSNFLVIDSIYILAVLFHQFYLSQHTNSSTFISKQIA